MVEIFDNARNRMHAPTIKFYPCWKITLISVPIRGDVYDYVPCLTM
jgi:hypothetical protein